MLAVLAGGSALAKKLISIYFTLFQLILEGKVGHAHELKATQEAQQAARGKGGAKKGGPKKKQRWKARPGGGKGAPGVANPGKPEAAPHPSQQPGTQVSCVSKGQWCVSRVSKGSKLCQD